MPRVAAPPSARGGRVQRRAPGHFTRPLSGISRKMHGGPVVQPEPASRQTRTPSLSHSIASSTSWAI